MVSVVLDIGKPDRDKSHLRTLPPIKTIYKAKVDKAKLELEDSKDKRAYDENALQKLHQAVDQLLIKHENARCKAAKKGDTTKLWEILSQRIEQGMLAQILEEKELDKRHKGRGSVKVVTTSGDKAGQCDLTSEEHIRNKDRYAALLALKNARACEQIAYRIELLQKSHGGQGPSVQGQEHFHAEQSPGVHA